jgi:toxin ParE1/3/4
VKIVYHKSVQRDIDEAWRWYEDASPGLGDEFFDEFLSVIEGIRSNPQRWAFTTRGRRMALFGRFPYKLLYRVESERVKVFVVMHQKRHPAFGAQRK